LDQTGAKQCSQPLILTRRNNRTKIITLQEMKKFFILFFFGTFLFLSACKESGVDEIVDDEEPSVLDPVETLPPNASFTPAFEGQTRVAGMKTETEYTILQLVRDAQLYKPWSFKFIAEDKILLLQKDGVMRIISVDGNNVNLGAPLAGVPPVYFDERELTSNNTYANAGLFDVVLDPDFATNRLIYFSYSKGSGPSNRLTISKATLDVAGNRLTGVSEIYRVSHAHAGTSVYGGRLLFDRSGYLLVTTGDRNRDDSRYMAQNLNSTIGKILRLDKEGNPAPGNPFAGTPGALPEIWAAGIRSPLGITLHPTTGEIWESENGPKGGDELNIIRSGANYGWPLISYGIQYDGTAIGRGIFQIAGAVPPQYYFDANNLTGGGLSAGEGFEQPRYYWDPAVAPAGMTFYTSDVIPEWKDNLFIVTLAGQHLIRLKIQGDKVIGEERLMDKFGMRLRDIQQGPDGALYVVTDTKEGRIYRIGK